MRIMRILHSPWGPDQQSNTYVQQGCVHQGGVLHRHHSIFISSCLKPRRKDPPELPA
jgi:hypothetical protein